MPFYSELCKGTPFWNIFLKSLNIMVISEVRANHCPKRLWYSCKTLKTTCFQVKDGSGPHFLISIFFCRITQVTAPISIVQLKPIRPSLLFFSKIGLKIMFRCLYLILSDSNRGVWLSKGHFLKWKRKWIVIALETIISI